MFKKNQDFVGWLTVDGTKIDYPVMHTPEDEEFYLRSDFEKKWSIEGTPFVAGKCDPLKPSDNVIIYGHNMNTGTLFGELTKFEDKDFYNNSVVKNKDSLTEIEMNLLNYELKSNYIFLILIYQLFFHHWHLLLLAHNHIALQ